MARVFTVQDIITLKVYIFRVTVAEKFAESTIKLKTLVPTCMGKII
jgi:hypothetical protein